MSDYYVLDADHNLVQATLMEWAAMFEKPDARKVGADTVDGVRVSTVFLGLDHSFGSGPGLWFETMVFGGDHDEWTDRYTTWAEAEAGHARVLAAIREGREP